MCYNPSQLKSVLLYTCSPTDQKPEILCQAENKNILQSFNKIKNAGQPDLSWAIFVFEFEFTNMRS